MIHVHLFGSLLLSQENSQTTEFCEKLSISDPLRLLPAYANGLGNSGRQADRTSDEGFEYHDSHPGMEEALGSRTAESTSFTRVYICSTISYSPTPPFPLFLKSFLNFSSVREHVFLSRLFGLGFPGFVQP